MTNLQSGPRSTSDSTSTPPFDSSSDVDFSVISHRGDMWSIQRRGSQTELMWPSGEGAATSIDVIVVNASNGICSDGAKNLAVVPLSNLRNEQHGGAVLLRVSGISLQRLARFGEQMEALGY